MGKTETVKGGLMLEAEKLRDLLERTSVENPKQKDVEALRGALKEFPDLWHNIGGNLSKLATSRLIDNLTQQVTLREAARHGANESRKSLGWNDADMLEKMLIENVILMWIGFNDVQMRYISIRDGEGSISLEAGMYWEKRLTAAHRRYMRACETLARVRRLGKSLVQINIGDKQVNIAQRAATQVPSGIEDTTA